MEKLLPLLYLMSIIGGCLIAKRRGRWVAVPLVLFFPVIGFLFALCLKTRCPFCHEYMYPDATACSKCRRNLAPASDGVTFRERVMLKREGELRRQATACKRAKQYDKAVELLRAARRTLYSTSCVYDIKTLLRVPQYLILAGRYRDAINEANDIQRGRWKYREQLDAEFAAYAEEWIHETIAEAAEKLGNRVLAVKSTGAAKRAVRSIPMIRRAQAERECLKNLHDFGTDLVRVSSSCGGGPSDPCYAWHGRIISAFGKVAGFPTLKDLDSDAIFGGSLGHSLTHVDEVAHRDEIELQRAHPVRDFSPDALRRNQYEIEIARYVRAGKGGHDAVMAVARDRLERAIRVGLVIDARPIVDDMTDDLVTILCPGGEPPRFEPFKATKREKANGARESYVNGVLQIARDGITAAHIVEVFRQKGESRIVYDSKRHEYVKV